MTIQEAIQKWEDGEISDSELLEVALKAIAEAHEAISLVQISKRDIEDSKANIKED